jgi:hypothetical protein
MEEHNNALMEEREQAETSSLIKVSELKDSMRKLEFTNTQMSAELKESQEDMKKLQEENENLQRNSKVYLSHHLLGFFLCFCWTNLSSEY